MAFFVDAAGGGIVESEDWVVWVTFAQELVDALELRCYLCAAWLVVEIPAKQRGVPLHRIDHLAHLLEGVRGQGLDHLSFFLELKESAADFVRWVEGEIDACFLCFVQCLENALNVVVVHHVAVHEIESGL